MKEPNAIPDENQTNTRATNRKKVDSLEASQSNNNQDYYGRRSLLRNLSTVSVGILGSSVMSSSTVSGQAADNNRPLADDPDIPGGTETEPLRRDRRSYLVSEYGRKEASIIQGIATKYRNCSMEGDRDPEAAFQAAADEILEHPQTPKVSEDIQNRRALLTAEESQIKEDTPDSDGLNSTSDISTAAVGASTKVSPTKGQKGGSAWGIGAADREFSVSNQRIQANARVTGIGGGTAYARLYGRLTPSSSIGGAVRMTANYHRHGSVVGGNAEIRFFVRETARPSSTQVFRTVEKPGFSSGNTVRSEQFFLPVGVQHDIGIEILASVDTIAAAYFYADYLSTGINSKRRVVLNDPIRIESLD
jgi:hypothetical protein